MIASISTAKKSPHRLFVKKYFITIPLNKLEPAWVDIIENQNQNIYFEKHLSDINFFDVEKLKIAKDNSYENFIFNGSCASRKNHKSLRWDFFAVEIRTIGAIPLHNPLVFDYAETGGVVHIVENAQNFAKMLRISNRPKIFATSRQNHTKTGGCARWGLCSGIALVLIHICLSEPF